MLLSLHVRDLALIREEEIEFTNGLNILTGETGAGKSILIGSVNLALGAKAEKSLIRSGADSALIEMVFQADNARQLEALRDMGLEPDEDGVILVKRRILPNRSVCTVAGETVTLRQLREISLLLIDIYGQRENQKLLRREAQLETVDAYAGKAAAEARSEVSAAWKNWRSLTAAWDADDLDEASRMREADLLRYEVQEIEAAALKDGEEEELEARRRKLASFKKISEAASTAEMLLLSAQDSASGQIGRACRAMSAAAGCDEELDAIASQLDEIDGLLSDLGRTLSGYMSDLSYDPGELEMIEQRLDLIHRLEDKHGGSVEAVRKAMEAALERLAFLEDYEAGRRQLRARIDAAYRELTAACGRLSELRKEAGREFADRMKEELRELNFPAIGFELTLESGENYIGEDGCDRASFWISMNPGEPLRPLEQIASGGELSRIMLALKTVFAGKEDIHTFVFDEIDTGISGRTAWKVAERLGQLAGDHQILCITHLPQIAAMEDSHYLIEKESDGERTATHIRRLDEQGSREELARLLGGGSLTEAALSNAEEMKRMAAAAKRGEPQVRRG